MKKGKEVQSIQKRKIFSAGFRAKKTPSHVLLIELLNNIESLTVER